MASARSETLTGDTVRVSVSRAGQPWTSGAATLCPDCQDQVSPRDVRSELYGYGKMSTAHLYAVPVLAAFDAIRNCSHCRRNTDDNCKAWREARRLVKGVDELRDATGGCAANIYQFACGSVAYFAPDAPDFQEAGEAKGRRTCQGLASPRCQGSAWRKGYNGVHLKH